jgi:hypothetical protein
VGKDAGTVQTPILKQSAPVDAESLYAPAWYFSLVHDPFPQPLCTKSRCEFRNDILADTTGQVKHGCDINEFSIPEPETRHLADILQ